MITRTRALALRTIFVLASTALALSLACSQSRVLSTQELTDQSDVVAVGTVSAVQSEWNAEKTRIITRVNIRVREFLKGVEPDQSLVVVTPGGEVGDVGEIYSTTVRFNRDEEVVVFARKKSGRDHEVSGGQQGRVPVRVDRVTGIKMVQRGTRFDDYCTQVRSAAQAARPEEARP